MSDLVTAAEAVARMTREQRTRLVEDLVAKWPNLASDLSTELSFALQDELVEDLFGGEQHE